MNLNAAHTFLAAVAMSRLARAFERDPGFVPEYLRRKRKPRKSTKPDTRNVVPIRAHR